MIYSYVNYGMNYNHAIHIRRHKKYELKIMDSAKPKPEYMIHEESQKRWNIDFILAIANAI